MNFLFWNLLKKNSFYQTIVSIIQEEDVDVVAFAEFGDDSNIPALIKELAKAGLNYSILDYQQGEKTRVFYKEGTRISSSYNHKRVFGKRLLFNEKEFTLVFCHLTSMFNNTDSDQQSRALNYVTEIKKIEEEDAMHTNTIVCGDFNMDPFHLGMLHAMSFNATMNIHIANGGSRQFDGASYDFFYNPMWNLLGDDYKGRTSGTFFFGSPRVDQKYWHMLDQVIIRPAVIPSFDFNELKIISKGSSYDLLENNKISSQYSDHLPIKFKLL